MPNRRKTTVRRKKSRIQPPPPAPVVPVVPPPPDGGGSPFWVAVSLILALLAFQVVPQHRISSGFNWIPSGAWPWVLALGSLVTAWLGFGNQRTTPAASDLSRGTAWFSLAVILFIGLKIRLLGLGSPVYFYWDEIAESSFITRSFRELGGWKAFYPGDQSPLYHYWCSWIWNFLPNTLGLENQRIANALMDCLTVWLMYLVGREFGGRRGGVVVAALGAVSRPMIGECFRGLQVATIHFSVALAVLACFRFVSKPTWKRSLFWALSLVFMIYSYAGVRPLLPVFFLLPGVAFLWKSSELNQGNAWKGFSWVAALLWLSIFSICSRFWNVSAPAQQFIQKSGFNYAVGLAALWLLFILYRKTNRNGREPWLAWMGGGLLALTLALPYWTHPYWSRNYSDGFILKGLGPSRVPSELFSALGARFMNAMQALFLGAGEYSDSLFEWTVAAAGITALGALISRRERPQAFLLASSILGMIAYVLTANPHNARAMAMVVPFLAFIGVAYTRLWEDSASRPVAKQLVPLGLLGLMAWTAIGNIGWLGDSWLNRETIHGLVARRVLAAPVARRVYLSPQAGTSWPVQSVLAEGRDVLGLEDENTITLGIDEKAPDLTVLISSAEVKWKELLSHTFPKATWLAHPLRQDSNSAVHALLEITIPGPHWSEMFRGPFRSVRVDGRWRRKVYGMTYGFGHGTLRSNDLVSSWNDGAAPDWGGRVIRLSGTFKAPQDGNYKFVSDSSCRIRVTVSGHKVYDVGPRLQSLQGSGSIRLKAGETPIDILVYLYGTSILPRVTVEGPGLNSSEPLGG